MKRSGSRLLGAALVVVVVPLLLAGCGGSAVDEASGDSAVVEHVKGTKAERVRLTEEAAKRLDIHTTPVRSDGPGTHRLVIPYAAVLYDPDGNTWTYTNPSPLVYQRHDISVDRIDGDSVILSKGPPVGTAVVTVGASEIWGVEYGGIEED